jgi:hypothetical protein
MLFALYVLTMCVAVLQRLYERIKSIPGSVEITVNARSCTKIPFIVPKGKELVWKMQVKDYDLGFAVRLRQQGEGGAVETDLLPMEKISVSFILPLLLSSNYLLFLLLLTKTRHHLDCRHH